MTDVKRRNINTLTYSSAILVYMEIFALSIVLAFSAVSASIGLIVAGLLIWLVANILFGVYYMLVMRHDVNVVMVVDKMSSQSKCVYYTILGLSIAVSLRTYRLLYCGLFRGVAPYLIKEKKK